MSVDILKRREQPIPSLKSLSKKKKKTKKQKNKKQKTKQKQRRSVKL